MVTDWIFYAVAIPAVILMGLAKGGFSGIGVLGVPLMTLAVSPVRAAAIALPILIVQDVVSVWAFRHDWDKWIVGVMLPGIIIGSLISTRISDALLRPILAGTLAIVGGKLLF